MRARQVFLVLLGLLLAACLGLALLARSSFRRETGEAPSGWPQAALLDDTLVLEKWLAANGWTTRRGGGEVRPEALPGKGLLILVRVAHPLTEAETDALLAWVRGGGTLLLDATASPFSGDEGTRRLLDRLSVSLAAVPKESQAPNWNATDRFDGTPYAMQRSPHWRLKVDREAWSWWMGSDAGEVLVRRAEGQGELLLASDLSFLYNDAFVTRDHAAWLARILEDVPRAEAVVWSRPAPNALLPWLWQRAWRFLAAVGALLGAWLWAGLWRFGPYLPPPPAGRRSVLEHLAASGRFLWRHGGREALLAVSRAAVDRRAARHHPAFPALARDDRYAYLAQASGLPPEQVYEAMDQRPGTAPASLARHLLILQHLRHRLG